MFFVALFMSFSLLSLCFWSCKFVFYIYFAVFLFCLSFFFAFASSLFASILLPFQDSNLQVHFIRSKIWCNICHWLQKTEVAWRKGSCRSQRCVLWTLIMQPPI
jgi:hypothetical protein